MTNTRRTPTPSERTRASKLRLLVNTGKVLAPEDAEWLATYEQEREATAEAIGASQTKRIHYTEEQTQALGTGDAAMQAAGAAAMVREEGRRIDSLISIGIQALRMSVDTYQKMAEQMLKRNEQLERAHVELMQAQRTHYLARVEAEGEIERLRSEGGGDKDDSLSKIAEQLLPYILPELEGRGIEIGEKKP